MSTQQPSQQNIPFVLKDKNGKEINQITLASGVVATIVGYDEKSGTFILYCDDNRSNREKYTASENPKNKRQEAGENSHTMQLIKQGWNKGFLPISVSLNSNMVQKQADGSYQLTTLTEQQFKAHRSLMHIDKRTQEEREKDYVARSQKSMNQSEEKKESWWGKHWWKVAIGLLLALTIGVLGFRKGGWWNKRKKRSNTKKSTPETTTGATKENTVTKLAQTNALTGVTPPSDVTQLATTQLVVTQATQTQPAITQTEVTQAAQTQPAITQTEATQAAVTLPPLNATEIDNASHTTYKTNATETLVNAGKSVSDTTDANTQLNQRGNQNG